MANCALLASFKVYSYEVPVARLGRVMWIMAQLTGCTTRSFRGNLGVLPATMTYYASNLSWMDRMHGGIRYAMTATCEIRLACVVEAAGFPIHQ